ncbi:MAG: GGDEF domain-containing protein [Gammaproteobacteria bacterium]
MKSFPYQYIPAFNFFLGVSIWILDAAVDAFFMRDDHSFIDSLLFAEGSELWMRALVIVILVSVGFYAKSIIHRQKQIENELLKHKNNLEDMVKERIVEINEKNIELKQEVESRKLAENELEHLATTDPLTSLYNRRKAHQFLEDEIGRVNRYKDPLSVVMIDIDHFKAINDLHGHAKGDEVLTSFSKMLLSSVRSTDIVSRWGGEEFLIICISSPAEKTVSLAEKLRKKVEQHDFDGLKQVTFSAGVAQYDKDNNLVDFINRADKALYIAKSTGRNTVKLAT